HPFGMPATAQHRTGVQVAGAHGLTTGLEAVRTAVRSWLPSVLAQTSRPASSLQHFLAMNLAAEIFVVVILIAPLAVILYLFVWAARKDGEEDRALQRRLGIRRKTRLGR